MNFSELVARAQDGDREILEGLLARWRPWLRHQARGLLRSPAAARLDSSDVVQHTLFKAYRNLRRFRGHSPGEFSNWLRQILRSPAASIPPSVRPAGWTRSPRQLVDGRLGTDTTHSNAASRAETTSGERP
jgi:hypothetical protein